MPPASSHGADPSESPIPGDVAFENFELVEPFRQGRELVFSVEPLGGGADLMGGTGIPPNSVHALSRRRQLMISAAKMSLRRVALPILVLAFALTGCTAAPAPTPSPTQAETATPTPVETSSPEPEPSAAPAATCDDISTAEAYDKLAADGLTPREPDYHSDLWALMVERGAVGCTWTKPQTDITLSVAQLAVDDAAWTEWSTALADAGYTQTDNPVAGAFEGPIETGSGIATVVVRGDGVLTFVSVPAYAGWIAPRA